MIYFLQSSIGNPIKIGATTNLIRRLSSLQNQYRSPLHALGVMDGGFSEERALHKKFSHLRANISGSREWFRPETELLEFIDAEAREWDGEIDKPEMMPELIVGLVGNPEVRTWLEELANEVNAPVSSIVDMALKEFAASRKFRVMPRRLAR